MIKSYLEKLINKEHLSEAEAYDVMLRIMSGEVSPVFLSALLISLKSKGESPDEISGFVKAMREKSIKINAAEAIDVCGTGGDSSGTFNISTAVAFVVAGTGIKVAKHGNKSVSSNSGSADVLKELGVNIEMKPEKAEACINEIGITFLYAPLYHPAMKYAAETRKELGIRTVFNMIGPMTNPASVKRQIIGTFNDHSANLLCESANRLEYTRVNFICNDNRYDEILLDNRNVIFEFDYLSGNSRYFYTSDDFRYPSVSRKKLQCHNSKESASIILNLLQNISADGAFHTVTANAAVALRCAGYSESLDDCLGAAEKSVRSGAAYNKLKKLVEYSNK